MQLFDPNNPNEKKKMIAAGVLAVLALAVLGYVFFGGSSKKPATTNNVAVKPSPAPIKISRNDPPPDGEDLSDYKSIVYTHTVPAVPEADRNIFAYYEPTPRPTPPPYIPTPTPAPTPPLIISAVMPANVYAGTPGDFGLQVMGDKLTPSLHITIDGRDVPTRYINGQQLFTTVPATLILNPGSRQVMVRSNDGKVYSNTLAINITPAPTPNYNYVGLIGKPRFNDTAVLQDKSSKDLVTVQRGTVFGGQFRVTSISEKEIKFINTTLKIEGKIGFSVEAGSNPQFRPPVRTSDEEPQ